MLKTNHAKKDVGEKSFGRQNPGSAPADPPQTTASTLLKPTPTPAPETIETQTSLKPEDDSTKKSGEAPTDQQNYGKSALTQKLTTYGTTYIPEDASTKKSGEAPPNPKITETIGTTSPPQTPETTNEPENAVFEALKAAWKFLEDLGEQLNAGGWVSTFTVLAFVTVVVSGFAAVMYCVMLIMDYTNNILIKNPTNVESLDFLIGNFGNNVVMQDGSKETQSIWHKWFGPMWMNMIAGKYKYGLFIFLPWLVITFSGIGLILLKRKAPSNENITMVKFILFTCLFQGIIALVINNIMFFYAFYTLRLTSYRINQYNEHVLNNMIQKAEFLQKLQKLPTNAFSTMEVVQSALTSLFRKKKQMPSSVELGKAMFTLNLYMHYQELGYRNPIILDAIKSFRIYAFVRSKQLFSPANYLRRRVTFIKDNSELFRKIADKHAQGKTKSIDEAVILSAKMTAEANNLANTFYPDDAMVRFLVMAVVIAIVQVGPAIIIGLLANNQLFRKGFIKFITQLFEKATQKNDDSEVPPQKDKDKGNDGEKNTYIPVQQKDQNNNITNTK